MGNEHTKFENLDEELANPTDLRVFSIASALEEGYTIERIYELTKIDPWFLGKLKNIVDYKNVLSTYNKVEDLPEDVLRQAKVLGFSDFQIARFVTKATCNMEKENSTPSRSGKPRSRNTISGCWVVAAAMAASPVGAVM